MIGYKGIVRRRSCDAFAVEKQNNNKMV